MPLDRIAQRLVRQRRLPRTKGVFKRHVCDLRRFTCDRSLIDRE